MYGCVSDEGIRLDLQAMHDTGIAGFYLMPIKDTTDGKQYGGTASQLTAEWWKRMDTVFHVADSLHLQMGIHFSDGFALGGGPWITPEESMQRVVWSDTIVNGGKQQLTSLLKTCLLILCPRRFLDLMRLFGNLRRRVKGNVKVKANVRRALLHLAASHKRRKALWNRL